MIEGSFGGFQISGTFLAGKFDLIFWGWCDLSWVILGYSKQSEDSQ